MEEHPISGYLLQTYLEVAIMSPQLEQNNVIVCSLCLCLGHFQVGSKSVGEQQGGL